MLYLLPGRLEMSYLLPTLVRLEKRIASFPPVVFPCLCYTTWMLQIRLEYSPL